MFYFRPNDFSLHINVNINRNSSFHPILQSLFRVAKILRFGRTRTMVGVDIYNATNANPTVSLNNTFGGTTWLTPTSILNARFAKISMQLDF